MLRPQRHSFSFFLFPFVFLFSFLVLFLLLFLFLFLFFLFPFLFLLFLPLFPFPFPFPVLLASFPGAILGHRSTPKISRSKLQNAILGHRSHPEFQFFAPATSDLAWLLGGCFIGAIYSGAPIIVIIVRPLTSLGKFIVCETRLKNHRVVLPVPQGRILQ